VETPSVIPVKVETPSVIPAKAGIQQGLSFAGIAVLAMILIWIPDQVGNDSIIADHSGEMSTEKMITNIWRR
jgi:hypothetical protein